MTEICMCHSMVVAKVLLINKIRIAKLSEFSQNFFSKLRQNNLKQTITNREQLELGAVYTQRNSTRLKGLNEIIN